MREATEDDISDIVRMAKAFCSALGETYDEESIVSTATNLIHEPSGVLLLIDGGMAGAMLIPSFLNHSAINAAELFWWVDPDKRGGKSGILLLNGLELWARAHGAERLSMIEMSALGNVGKLYERHGYYKAETTYVKEL